MKRDVATINAWRWLAVRLVAMTVLLLACTADASITRGESRNGVGIGDFGAVGTVCSIISACAQFTWNHQSFKQSSNRPRR